MRSAEKSRPSRTQDLLLGYLSPDRFLGGRMQLHPDRATQAIKRRIGDPLFGGDTLAAAGRHPNRHRQPDGGPDP
jgi:hypothetical protein